MWGAQQGWNQWAMQPAVFNDVPHEQIDWAALAKQWIQMQQPQPSVDPTVLPPTQVAPPSVVVPPLPPGHSPILPEELPPVSAPLLKTPVAPGTLPEPFQPERQFDVEPSTFVPKNHTYWKNEVECPWPVHPVEPAPAIIGGKETFDYGHMHDNPPLAMQSIDYNHMSEFSYNQVPQVYAPPETQYDQYWSQVNAAPPIAPMFLKKERSSAPSSSHRTEEDSSQIDAAKRKQLPAWIREGLEKMEQERIKKIEKERAEKEKAEKLAKDKLKSESTTKEDGAGLMPVKSKFDSDSESEEVLETVSSNVYKSSLPVSKRSPSPDIRTEEEKREEFILNIRRILTEILLDVTNSEMRAVAEEVYKKAKLKKLKAQQLASTTKLASVASGLRGLAEYGTESEASEVEEEEKDSSDSEEELYRIVREKKKQFAIKGKKILAEIERKELEEQKEALKSKNGSSNPVESELVEPIRDSTKSFAVELKEPIPFLAPVPDDKDSSGIPFIRAKADSVKVTVENDSSKVLKSLDKKRSSDSSSSSSGSESSERSKSRKRESDKKSSSKDARGKSASRKHHSRSSESDSSDRHHKSRSHDRYSKKSSSSKKKKKYKRSDSSSSSSSEARRKRHSSKLDSSHNHYRDHRSESYEKDRKHRSSVSPRSHRSSRDSYRSRESYNRHDRDKYDKRDGHYDHKRSPSPRRQSKLPKKYRSSRSPSSERESSRKSKRSRNH